MKEKVKTVLIILLVIIIILLLLLIFRGLAKGTISEENSKILEFASEINFPLEYKILKVKEVKNKPEVIKDERSITYSGSGRYEISEENPYIVLSNPEVNFVDMIFEIKDIDKDILLLKTDKIMAGEYLYVNVFDFFNKTGVYHISIDIASYDHENGVEKNGMHEEAEIIVN